LIWTSGLLKGIFGTKAWMRELAHDKGSLTSAGRGNCGARKWQERWAPG
jgi:hypothetical protein